MINNQIHFQYQKSRQYQGLKNIPVLLQDNSLNSNDYFVVSSIPNQLSSGLNSFKLKGNPLNLKAGSSIAIEILDANNNVIYHEISDYRDRNNNLIVSIYIYPNNAIGIAQITILGVAAINTISNQIITDEWKNKYNIKWTYQLNCDPYLRNNNDIIFKQEPQISISEIFKKQNKYLYYTGSNIISSSNNNSYYKSNNHYVKYNSVSNITTIANNYIEYQNNYTQYSNGVNSNQGDNYVEFLNSNQLNQQSIYENYVYPNNNIITSKYQSSFRNESAPYLTLNYPITASEYTFKFTKQMEGGKIKINNPNTPYPFIDNNIYNLSSGSLDIAYEGIIVKVINDTTAFINKPYTRKLKNKINNSYQDINYTSFEQSEFEVSYSSPYTILESQAYKNYAQVNISNIELLSGDVFRIKPYVRSVTDDTNYVPMTDIIINSKNILLSTSSIDLEESIGSFNTNIISSYWMVSNYSDALSVKLNPNNTKIINACNITSSTVQNSGYIIMQQKNNTLFEVDKNIHYEINLNLYCQRTTTNIQELILLLSGSAFNNDNYNGYNGYFVADIKLPNDQNELLLRNLNFNFTPNQTGNGKLIFIVKGGNWMISDIEIKPIKQLGFTPKSINFLIPLQPNWDNDTLDFKFEMYDYQNNLCNQLLFVRNVHFDNGYSHYIQGKYNLITGSAWIGRNIQSGIEMSGKSSGIVKSYGYAGSSYANNGGTPGFLLWSGSFQLIDPGLSYPTDYDGVGLELHGGSASGHALHFDTVTGILQLTGSIIATDAVLENYVIADYIGSRIIVINDLNKLNYLKNYTYNSRQYTYIDLSGIIADSGMFIRFETIPDYPITHIQVPEMYSFTDNQVGGDITIEFKDGLSNMYFADIAVENSPFNVTKYEGNLYTPALPKLTISNAIRRYAGSFSYLGFIWPLATPYIYTSLLKSRTGARYIFTKGYDGFGLTSATNYDTMPISFKSAYIGDLYGNRRNTFIPVNNISFNNSYGTASLSTWNGFDCWKINSDEPSGFSYFKTGKFNFSFIVPDYIISQKVYYYNYFAFDTGTGMNQYVRNYNQTYKKFNHLITETEQISTTINSGINSSNYRSLTDNTLVYIIQTEISNVLSSDIFNVSFDVQQKNINTIYFLGTRIIFDRKTNAISYDTQISPSPADPTS